MLTLDTEQRHGAKFLAANPVAMLADKMGIGKTGQWVRALDRVAARRVTILCPPVLRYQLASEYLRFSMVGLPVTIAESSKTPVPDVGLFIASYNALDNGKFQRALARRRVDALILEESHALKNPDGLRSKNVFLKRGVAHNAARVWFITATPAQNGVWELYPFLAASGLFDGTYNQFLRSHITTRSDGMKEIPVGAKDPSAFRKWIDPLFLQRSHDVIGQPLTIDVMHVPGRMPDINDEARGLIERALATGNWNLDEAPALATGLRAIGLAQMGGAIDLIRHELESGADKIIVFANTVDVIAGVCRELAAYGALPINGKVTPKQKELNIAAFKHAGCRVLACNFVSASEGLNLTESSRIFLIESSWNPEKDAQAIARAYRRGQLNPCHASYIAIPDSLSTRVMATAARKAKEIKSVFGDV